MVMSINIREATLEAILGDVIKMIEILVTTEDIEQFLKKEDKQVKLI